jgi:hypothetical protein
LYMTKTWFLLVEMVEFCDIGLLLEKERVIAIVCYERKIIFLFYLIY